MGEKREGERGKEGKKGEEKGRRQQRGSGVVKRCTLVGTIRGTAVHFLIRQARGRDYLRLHGLVDRRRDGINDLLHRGRRAPRVHQRNALCGQQNLILLRHLGPRLHQSLEQFMCKRPDKQRGKENTANRERRSRADKREETSIIVCTLRHHD